MRLLDLLLFTRNQPTKDPRLTHEGAFTDLPLRLLPTPILARMDVPPGSPPLVKFAGTFWRFRVYGSEPCTFVDGQMVKILGRQGNCLLIELETSND
ncbi:MAG: hypothetical protein HC769_11520 [Cyanobacteria bacterium CRU_2_1]|nr:hypothetical protein [Cyanobacteria bacterium CRU_2_1]